MPDFTYDVGRVSFIMKGAWNLATSYEKLDAVFYNGSLYIAKQNVPGGTAITNTTYWQLAAEKGDKGDTGGVDSVNGQQGDVWFPDSRQLISDGYTTDTDPFLMKGNDSDSDRFELAKKLGNTVAVNQLVNNSSFSNVHGENGVSVSWTDTSTLSISGTTSAAAWIYAQTTNIIAANNHTYLALTDVVPSNARFGILEYTGGSFIYAPEGEKYVIYTNVNGIKAVNFSLPTSVTYNFTSKPRLIDLSLWFGSNDRIPSDLLSHPENWGRYYAGSLDYNAGTLESADGTKLTSIGTDGVTVLTEVDTGSEVLRSAGSVADEKTPDGTITRRVGVVDLGTLDYNYRQSGGRNIFEASISGIKQTASGSLAPNWACAKYRAVSYNATWTDGDMSVGSLNSNLVDIINNSYTSASAFKSAMSGIYLYYELATPTTEQGTAFEPLVVTVKNGVLSWTNTKGIPVGHESHYFENLRKRVEDRLPDPPSGDGTYRLTCTISGGVKTYSWEA